MKIRLIRNLETARNKEQEDSFNETMNHALYFDINKTINKVDAWKLSSVKKLVDKFDPSIELDIEFASWTPSVEYIFENSNIELIEYFNIDEKITNSLRKRDFLEIQNYLLSIKEDKNKKLEFLFAMASELKNEKEVPHIINKFINGGISTIDLAIDVILPLLFIGEGHE